MKKWLTISKNLIRKSVIFENYSVRRKSPLSGNEGDFEVLECRDWVNVIARDSHGEFILVKQYRHGVDEITIEFPAGVMEKGENPADTAARELREETGHISNKWVDLGSCNPNPAFIKNSCHFFFADNCEYEGELILDHFEEIEIVTMDLQELKKQVLSGKISHSLTHTGLLKFLLNENT